MAIGDFFHDAGELMSDPPAKLTAAGLRMLVNIWEGMGEPTQEEVEAFLDVADMETFTKNPRSGGQVLGHLMSGGYLHIMEEHDPTGPNLDMNVYRVSLSEHAFEALAAAGHIPPPVKTAARKRKAAATARKRAPRKPA